MKIQASAVVWGLAIYVGLYVLHILLLPALLGGGGGSALLYGLSQFLGLATCLLAGYVAAKKAGELGFLHGLAVGVLGTLISLTAAMIWAAVNDLVSPDTGTLPFWMLVNGFLCGFAGLVAGDLKFEEKSQPAARSRKLQRPPFEA